MLSTTRAVSTKRRFVSFSVLCTQVLDDVAHGRSPAPGGAGPAGLLRRANHGSLALPAGGDDLSAPEPRPIGFGRGVT